MRVDYIMRRMRLNMRARARMRRAYLHARWRAERAVSPLPVVALMSERELADEIRSRLFRSAGWNDKLGRVYTWSLPAVTTCSGRTRACESVCYARRLSARRPTVHEAWCRCLALTRHPCFERALMSALTRLAPGQIRVHVSGDFYSARYFLAWSRALALSPHLAPFAFTRAWRDSRVGPALDMVRPRWMLASVDAEASDAPAWMRRASMDETRTERRVRSGLQAPPRDVCPAQVAEVRCDSCGKCSAINPRTLMPVAPRDVVFLLH